MPNVPDRSFSLPASGNRTPSRSETAEELFRKYSVTRSEAVRDQLVFLHERLVHYFALRLSTGSGATYEDLVQVGYIGLITAIERFDPDHGNSFVTYAAPTIVGVIKRYLRDHTWALKVPRRLRELGITLRKVKEDLEARQGRPPTVIELAAETGVSEEKIVEALELERAYQPMSLDIPRTEDSSGEGICTWEAIGELDPHLSAVEQKETLRRAIAELEERQQHIIYGRFFGEASQSQIAEQLGMSQMHVSRLERQALKKLRELLS